MNGKMEDYSTRFQYRGARPVKIANRSGARGDPGYQMRRQVELGDVDFVTGDYLAEMNLAENAEAYRSGKHPGYEPVALEGIQETIDLLAQKNVKLIINGGSLNPRGLAEECLKLRSSYEFETDFLMATERGLGLKVAYVAGDDLYEQVKEEVQIKGTVPDHLDSENSKVSIVPLATRFLERDIVSANAYLGARAIVKGLENGADIVICGRVADASPVIGAAWYWHSWSDTDYDQLAQCLIAGHLIECSAYVTGANYAAFYEEKMENLIDLGFPIVQVARDGTLIVCKHETSNGLVTVDTVKCQFLYELQGNIYLNSDVTAILDEVKIEQVGNNRVQVTGILGRPPPPTTKLAIFYRGGYQSQIFLNATGFAAEQKWQLYEAQIRFGLEKKGILSDLEVLEFQIIGTREPDPSSQLKSTTYCRVFAQAVSQDTIVGLLTTVGEFGMQHFSGFHLSLDLRTALPLPYVAFYPVIFPQNNLDESVVFLSADGQIGSPMSAGHPPKYEAVLPRENYEPTLPVELRMFGPTKRSRLGDIALARSGDKGANINIGLFVREEGAWPWIRSFITIGRMKQLMGKDWSNNFFIERVEFPHIWAVHFVIYGCLGRGVSSSSRLDALGKGFADFIRDRVVNIPELLLHRRKSGP